MHRCKRLVEVGNQVFHIFDAHREADQPVGDADLLPHFGRHRGVRHGSGMGDQSFHAAEAFRERAQLHVIEQACGQRRASPGRRRSSRRSRAAGAWRFRAADGRQDRDRCTRFTFGMGFEELAMAMPFASWRSMRTASVLMPRETRKQSMGARPAPAERWRK